MKRIKILASTDFEKLEELVNNFSEATYSAGYEIDDIKYQYAESKTDLNDTCDYYSAMIIYNKN